MALILTSVGDSIEFDFPPSKTGTVSASFTGPHVKHVEIHRSDSTEVVILPGCSSGTQQHDLTAHVGPASVSVKVTPLYTNILCTPEGGYGHIPFGSPETITPNRKSGSINESIITYDNDEGDTVSIVIAITEEDAMGHRKLWPFTKLLIVGALGTCLGVYASLLVLSEVDEDI